ncbi:hypothetical protein G5714_006197 [Xyrichtys novacula]|uniref:Uncharacterized protein n=1 Tax=Xyrichtys novacula TaxID=13765 RepID=A0AAV1F9Y9_XYRNO|nr:hypothetical protein G5714_006197 [Xyrichtys novacula]
MSQRSISNKGNDNQSECACLRSTRSSGLSSSSKISMAVAMAKAKAEAAQARAAHSQREIELKVEQARIQANLDALNAEKDKDAAIAEANTLLAGLQDMGFEVRSEANDPHLQSKVQCVASYVSEQASLSNKSLSAKRESDNASPTCYSPHPQPTVITPSQLPNTSRAQAATPTETVQGQDPQPFQISGAPPKQGLYKPLNHSPTFQPREECSQQNFNMDPPCPALQSAHRTSNGASQDYPASTGDLIKYLALPRRTPEKKRANQARADGMLDDESQAAQAEGDGRGHREEEEEKEEEDDNENDVEEMEEDESDNTVSVNDNNYCEKESDEHEEGSRRSDEHKTARDLTGTSDHDVDFYRDTDSPRSRYEYDNYRSDTAELDVEGHFSEDEAWENNPDEEYDRYGLLSRRHVEKYIVENMGHRPYGDSLVTPSDMEDTTEADLPHNSFVDQRELFNHSDEHQTPRDLKGTSDRDADFYRDSNRLQDFSLGQKDPSQCGLGQCDP